MRDHRRQRQSDQRPANDEAVLAALLGRATSMRHHRQQDAPNASSDELRRDRVPIEIHWWRCCASGIRRHPKTDGRWASAGIDVKRATDISGQTASERPRMNSQGRHGPVVRGRVREVQHLASEGRADQVGDGVPRGPEHDVRVNTDHHGGHNQRRPRRSIRTGGDIGRMLWIVGELLRWAHPWLTALEQPQEVARSQHSANGGDDHVAAEQLFGSIAPAPGS